ncbi:MAG: PilZ domain-containing protein [Myxococcales bacterium]
MQLRELPNRAERVPVQLTVHVVVDGETYSAELVNLSLTGSFLEASFPVGSRLEIQVGLPGGDPLTLAGQVVREGWCPKFVDHPKVDNLAVRALGVGVRFDDLEDEDAMRLQDYLDLIMDRS